MSGNETDAHRAAFREEAYELLTELESSLLELEEMPQDGELIGKVFRAMHTIKGSGAMFGFNDIARFTHEVETVFDQVRNGTIFVTKELIDLTLRSRDCIRAMLDTSYDEGEGENEISVGEIISSLKGLLPVKEPEKVQVESISPPSSTQGSGQTTYRIRFQPPQDIFQRGTNPLFLLNELRELGDSRMVAQLDSIPPIKSIDPELCYVYWDIVLTTDRGIDAIRDVFIFVEDISEVRIEVIDEGAGEDQEDSYKLIGEILIERGDIKEGELKKILLEKKPIGEILVDKGLISRDKVESALVEQKHLKETREKRQKEESVSSIKVAAEKLDALVDLVGELVTVQARLSQKSNIQADAELTIIAEEVERLTEELRDNTMSIRMLPIGTTFGRFKRLVRDLSQELKKEIDLVTEGAETALDKTVLERLNDPLVHIIRNSIDHGVESPEVRVTRGKERKGTIHLSATYAGASVLISVRDDGAGLDSEAIRKKAIEKGLIAHDADITEKELFSLIFAPGFSTAKTVTGVSGRGVGMDVVKRTIDTLRGVIDVTSKRGEGTTITLKLPLTLAIIDGLLVKVKEGFFVLPLSVVEECIELGREDVERAHGQHLVNLRGQLVPYIRLREMFGFRGDLPDIEQVVITEANGQRIGFTVDQVVGEHQTVIKTLSKVYKNADGVSGATIMGDGTVALILDVTRLSRAVEGEMRV